MGLLTFIVIGFTAGLMIHALFVDDQRMGVFATTGLGVVGALVGGLIGAFFHREADLLAFRPLGVIFSVIGTVVVLGVAAFVGRRRTLRI